jgi:hypothetical protein
LGLQRYIADDRFQGDIVLLEPRERDEKFFSVNPMAFWKRSEAARHGFESVRTTIEHNYDELSQVLGKYGLALDREAAGRRAARARSTHGWNAEVEPNDRVDERKLRLVGT